MSLLYVAAMLKAAEKYNKRYSKPKRKKPDWQSNSDRVVFSEHQYTYFDCLMLELKNKESRLYKFFKKIYDKSEELMKEYYDSIEQERKVFYNQIDEKKSDLEETSKKLPDSIKIMPYITLGFNSLELSIDNYQLLKLYPVNIPKDRTKIIQFCDEEIIKKISNRKKELKDKLKGFGSYDVMINEIEQKIKILKDKLKITILPKKRKELEAKIIQEERNVNILKNYKKELNTIENTEKLYIENKEEILLCFKKFSEIILLVDELHKFNNGAEPDFYNVRIKRQKEFFAKALDCIIKEDKMTEDDLQKIFLEMDKVEIKGRRGEYDFNYVQFQFWSQSTEMDNLRPLLSWFIQNLYEADKNFVERNINNLDENNDELPKKTK